MHRIFSRPQIPLASDPGLPDPPDFECIHKVGQAIADKIAAHLKSGEKFQGQFIQTDGKPTLNSLGDFGLSTSDLVAAVDVIKSCIECAEATKEFKVILAELSLFDPHDPSGERFYSIIHGPDTSAVHGFRSVMELNLGRQGTRGPIIPDPAFYRYPLYAHAFDEAKTSRPLEPATTCTFVGAFEAKRDPYYSNKTLTETQANSNILSFVRGVYDAVSEMKMEPPAGTEPNSSFDACMNLSFARPNPRPGSNGTDPRPLGGGGLFVFGKWQGPKNDDGSLRVYRLGLLLSAFLNNGILKLSHSMIETERAEREQRHRQYTASAHEIRVLVRLIEQRTPAALLEQIRMYFAVIFGTVAEEIPALEHGRQSGMYPKEFSLGDSLSEFASNAFRIAAKVHIGWTFCARFDPAAGERPNELEINLDEGAERQFMRICFDGENWELPVPVTDVKDRWFFFSALVCVFRNVLKHSEQGSPLNLAIEEGNPYLMVVTNIADQTPGIDTLSSRAWPGSTEEAIKFYVGQYNTAAVGLAKFEPINSNSGLPTGYWRTQLPLP